MAVNGTTAIVLLSGGLDSATAAYLAAERGFTVCALTVDYGQRHGVEVRSARQIAEAIGATEHKVIQLDLRSFGGSALTADIPVPKGEAAPGSANIPVTYVPARNTILLALALAYAEAVGAADIFIGVNAVDYSGYPDCRPAFIEQFEKLAALATKAGAQGCGFKIHAPLIGMRKAEIVHEGLRLGVDFAKTHSCYDPDEDGRACGQCESCLLRRQGFKDAGAHDPTRYARSPG